MKSFTKTIMCLAATLISAITYAQIPALSSMPSAPSNTATIYLDFDGQTVNSAGWNNGQTLVCAAPALTSDQITEIFNRVSEDYRPFNINITTDLAKFTAAPLTKRVRIIVTPTSAWKPGVGGVSYVGSFTWGDDTPGFVFSDRLANSAKYIGECCTHESGHTVGLSHQSAYDSACNLTQTYSLGTGVNGTEISWAPVMGNSYYKNMTGWNNGPTPFGCTNVQDNLTIITTQNGFTYRADDYAETMANNTTALNNNFTVNGIITTPTDKDAFKYVLSQRSAIHLSAVPYGINNSVDGANLDVQVQVYDANKVLVGAFNPALAMSATVDTTLNAGTYYFMISGTGNQNTADYSSLGSYEFKGFTSALPIRDIALTGKTEKSKHDLNWTIIADEPIKTQVIQVSTDGVNFRDLYSMNTGNTTSFSYAPYENSNLLYRVKATNVLGQTAYSNVVSLKATDKPEKVFAVSTLVHDQMTINAGENFSYSLHDASGKMLQTGKGLKGFNSFNILNQPSGVYIVRMVSNSNQQSERIIKQ